jgi:hypothetical protein
VFRKHDSVGTKPGSANALADIALGRRGNPDYRSTKVVFGENDTGIEAT